MVHETKNKLNKNSSNINNRDNNDNMSNHKKIIGNNKFTLYKNKLLGEGSFGKVYLGKVNDTNDIVAIKTEEPKHNYLCKESSICKFLTEKREVPIGFSKYYWYGEDTDKHKYLVPRDLTVGQFIYVVRKRIHLPPNSALFLFVGEHNTLLPNSAYMDEIYDRYKNLDGFLYIMYSKENVFG